jgi:hypothetical protein
VAGAPKCGAEEKAGHFGRDDRKKKRKTKERTAADGGPYKRLLAEIAPVVELVGIFTPAVADVGAVVHVGDKDVFDAGIGLGLGLLHGLAEADDD